MPIDKNHQQQPDDYDTPWKRIVEAHFEEFVAFFLPEAYHEIDWSKGFEFLDKELSQITSDAEIGNRHMDKLAKVWKKSGDAQWVLIHTDIQGDRKANFAARMYTYHYRAYDIKKMMVVGLAILADESPTWRPVEFRQKVWGSEVVYRFNVVKLLDYQHRLDELEQSENIFALVVLVNLQAKKTKTDPEARYEVKWRLVRKLYQRGLHKKAIMDLFNFMDWVLALPDEAEKRFWSKLQQFQEDCKMPYVMNIERIWEKEGIQKGMAKTLLQLLQMRFDFVPEPIREKVTSANQDELTAWIGKIFQADSLQAVFQ